MTDKFQPRPWFRHYAGSRNDVKLKLLNAEDRGHWWDLVEMKCEGELDKGDTADDLRERLIAAGLGLDPVAAAELKRRFIDLGLVAANWQPLGWDRRQFEGDFSAERTRNWRARQSSDGVVTSQRRHGDGDVTAQDSDSDTDKNQSERAPVDKSTARSPERITKAEAPVVLQRILDRTGSRKPS